MHDTRTESRGQSISLDGIWIYISIDLDNKVEVLAIEEANWRADILNYVKGLTQVARKRIRYKALRYVLIGNGIYYCTLEGSLVKCLGTSKALELMHDVDESACGTHQ